MNLKLLFIFIIILLMPFNVLAQEEPLEIGVVGLTHGHVHWILGREDRDEYLIVRIVELNRDLAER